MRKAFPALIVTLGLLPAASAQAQPKEGDVRAAIAAIVGPAYAVENLEFKNFYGDDSSVGRSSVMGTLTPVEPIFVREAEKREKFYKDVESRGIDFNRVSELLRRRFNRSVGNAETFYIHDVGQSGIPFSVELHYREKVSGFEFRHSDYNVAFKGYAQADLPKGAIVYGTPSYESILRDFESIHNTLIASMPSDMRIAIEKFQSGLDLYIHGSKLGVVRPYSTSETQVTGNRSDARIAVLIEIDCSMINCYSKSQGWEEIVQPDGSLLGDLVLIGPSIYNPDITIALNSYGAETTQLQGEWNGYEFFSRRTGFRAVPRGLVDGKGANEVSDGGAIELLTTEERQMALATSPRTASSSQLAQGVIDACALSGLDFDLAVNKLDASGWLELESEGYGVEIARRLNILSVVGNVSQFDDALSAKSTVANLNKKIVNQLNASSDYARVMLFGNWNFGNAMLVVFSSDGELRCTVVGTSLLQEADLRSEVRSLAAGRRSRNSFGLDDAVEISTVELPPNMVGNATEGAISLLTVDRELLPFGLQDEVASTFAFTVRAKR